MSATPNWRGREKSDEEKLFDEVRRAADKVEFYRDLTKQWENKLAIARQKANKYMEEKYGPVD